MKGSRESRYKKAMMIARERNPYKHLGLKGEKLLIKFRYNLESPVPFLPTWTGFWIPVFIENEYEKFLLCDVLEHKNPNGQRNSLPYKITINKHDMAIGLVTVKPYR